MKKNFLRQNHEFLMKFKIYSLLMALQLQLLL